MQQRVATHGEAHREDSLLHSGLLLLLKSHLAFSDGPLGPSVTPGVVSGAQILSQEQFLMPGVTCVFDLVACKVRARRQCPVTSGTT